MEDSRLRAFRLFTSFWLFGWLLKSWFYGVYLFRVIEADPLAFDFFPSFFRSAGVAQFFYVLPLMTAGVFLTRRVFVFRLSAGIMMISSCVLSMHQDTYNDATFVTSFWAAAWGLWLAGRGDSSRAKFLAALVIGTVFAGGFVGKLTGGYWDGSVLANIFGAYEAGFLIEWIKHSMSPAAQSTAFCALSRLVVIAEGLLAFSPFFPFRIIVRAGVPLLLCFALTNTVWIYSVLACLLGMVLAAERLGRTHS